MDSNNTVLLRVQLDTGATEKRLQELAVDLAKTKQQQQEVSKAFRQSKLSEEEFGVQSAKLAQQLRNQQTEQRSLTKNLENFRAGVLSTGDSVDELKARSAFLTTQYNAMSKEQRESTAEGQALTQQLDLINRALSAAGQSVNDFRRNVGQYPQLSEEARQGLAAMADELEKLRKEQAETAKAGGPVSPEATQRIQELEAALAQAKVANTQYGTSVVDLKRKLADLTAARDLAQDKEAVNELNAAILETRGALQEATGKVDEFGDKIEKNAKKEELATLSDAFTGVTAAIQLSTLATLDQEDADRATAVATQLLAQAEALRNLQIGVASTRDAGHIVLLKAKNLLFTEGAAATGANTAATAAGTAATTAQTAATGGATLAQQALNAAMTLNPIGLVVIALAAVVGGLLAFDNASDTTKRKVLDVGEKVLRYTNIIGLLVTGFQKLYDKSDSFRRLIDPIGQKLDSLVAKLAPVREFFGAIADKTAEAGRNVGEYVGLLDTAVEKAARASERAVEQSEKEVQSAQLRARELELAGARVEKYRATEREALAKQVEALRANNERQKAVVAEELAAIDKKLAANQGLGKSEQKLADERREREDKLRAAQIALVEFDQATQDKIEARQKELAAARKKELDDARNAAERAKKLAEQNLKDALTSQKQLLENRQQQIARLLEVVQQGSQDEETLLREQARNATNIQLADNSAAQVGALKKQQAVLLAARKEIADNGVAEQLRLDQQVAQQRAARAFELAMQGNQTQLAAVREGSRQELRLKQEAIALQLDEDIRAIDRRRTLEEREAQERRLRAQAQRDAAQLEYEDSRQLLEDFFAGRQQALEADHAAARVSEEQYQQGVYALQKARIDAATLLNQDYQKDTAELVREGMALDTEATAHYKQQIEEKVKTGVAFGQQVGSMFADMLTEQGQSLEEFTANVILTVLDGLQAQLTAQVAAATTTAAAGSYASPQSILTGGAAGFAQAALLAAAISAAFGAAKGIIRQMVTQSSSNTSRFAGGTVLGGAPHSQGGTQLISPSTGRHWGEAEQYEMVLTKNVFLTPGLREAANAINIAAGGRNLLAGTPQLTSRMALGNVLASPALVRQQLAGAAYEGGAGATVVQVPEIDYNRLAQAMQQVNIYTKTQEVMQSIENVNYTKVVIGSD